MSESELSRLPREREVAYFVHLHLTTVRCKARHPQHENEWVYEVEGKPRPMLVIRSLPKKDRGAKWFLALPITSKYSEERRATLAPIGNCLDSEVPSYVEMEIRKIPENMLHRAKSKSRFVKPCDPIGFANAVSIAMHKSLGNPKCPLVG